jgi:hypothetical protein
LVDLVDLQGLVGLRRELGFVLPAVRGRGRAPMPFGWRRSTRSTNCM